MQDPLALGGENATSDSHERDEAAGQTKRKASAEGWREMMRHKLNVILLVAITVLAGTPEALRQFNQFRNAVGDMRASAWNSLIVFASESAERKAAPRQRQQQRPAAEPAVAENEAPASAACPVQAAKSKANQGADERATRPARKAPAATPDPDLATLPFGFVVPQAHELRRFQAEERHHPTLPAAEPRRIELARAFGEELNAKQLEALLRSRAELDRDSLAKLRVAARVLRLDQLKVPYKVAKREDRSRRPGGGSPVAAPTEPSFSFEAAPSHVVVAPYAWAFGGEEGPRN